MQVSRIWSSTSGTVPVMLDLDRSKSHETYDIKTRRTLKCFSCNHHGKMFHMALLPCFRGEKLVVSDHYM